LKKLGSVKLQGVAAGYLIQTFTFDQLHCKWVAAISQGKGRESIWLAEFPVKPPYENTKLYEVPTGFSHPQDLTMSTVKGRNIFWLPRQDRKGVVGFALDSGGVEEVYNIGLFSSPVKGLFSAVSEDGNHLVVQGVFKGGGTKRQMAKVYNLNRLLSEYGKSDFLMAEPIYQWELDEAQQDQSQWRQGLAVVGNTVFVLSGNAKPSQKKLIGAYRLDGKVISIDQLPQILVDGYKERRSKTFEPEGLEVVSFDGVLGLTFGLAGGVKSRRTFDLWFVPLHVKN
jgi:hypothetical protein